MVISSCLIPEEAEANCHVSCALERVTSRVHLNPHPRRSAIRSSSMATQNEEIRRPMTPTSDLQRTQLTHATPIRHRGASSAAISSSKWASVAEIECVPMPGFHTHVSSRS